MKSIFHQAGAYFPLALGTAQLGMNYGVANTNGKPSTEEAAAIVQAAWNNGIRTFDTAQAYGESEQTLGSAFRQLGIQEQVRVVSKISPGFSPSDFKAIRDSVIDSISRLEIHALYGLLLHGASWLRYWDLGLKDEMARLVKEGLTTHVGASVYTVAEAQTALDCAGISIIQMPFNLFDQAAARKGFLALADERGCEIYIRSVFLQGVLLMAVDCLPQCLADAGFYLEKLDVLCMKMGLDRTSAALAYVLYHSHNGALVLGAETKEQVDENCSLTRQVLAMDHTEMERLVKSVEETLWVRDPAIINPSKWVIQQ